MWGITMNFLTAQQEIDSILRTLDEAEQYSGLGRDDPSVMALEEIMLAKVAALEAAKFKVAPVPDTATEPTEEQAAGPEPPLFFAPAEEERR